MKAWRPLFQASKFGNAWKTVVSAVRDAKGMVQVGEKVVTSVHEPQTGDIYIHTLSRV